jgi:hypothetical protein
LDLEDLVDLEHPVGLEDPVDPQCLKGHLLDLGDLEGLVVPLYLRGLLLDPWLQLDLVDLVVPEGLELHLLLYLQHLKDQWLKLYLH